MASFRKRPGGTGEVGGCSHKLISIKSLAKPARLNERRAEHPLNSGSEGRNLVDIVKERNPMKKMLAKIKAIVLMGFGRGHLTGNFPTPFRKIQAITCKVDCNEYLRNRKLK